MFARAVGVTAVLAAGLVPSCQPSCEPPPPPESRDIQEVVALVVDGTDAPWRQVIDADLVEARWGIGSLREVATEGAEVRLVGSTGEAAVPASELGAAYGLPSSTFTARGVARERAVDVGFTFIGDSLGVSVTAGDTDELPALLDGVFSPPARYDAVGGRCTALPGCASTGLAAAQAVPAGTQLVVVELGVNDMTGVFATKLDQVMQVLVDKGVPTVLWLTSSTRSPRLGASAAANNAQLVAAAAGRWAGRLEVVDWGAASAGDDKAHWFTSDLIHLTPTGQAHLALVIRDAVIAELPPS